MPQVWMTYDELARLCGCSIAEARLRARHLSLSRRKSSDGFTRVKLDLALTARFLACVREADFDLDGLVAALRKTHRDMAELLSSKGLGSRRGAA
jgi:hypothetical protein